MDWTSSRGHTNRSTQELEHRLGDCLGERHKLSSMPVLTRGRIPHSLGKRTTKPDIHL